MAEGCSSCLALLLLLGALLYIPINAFGGDFEPFDPDESVLASGRGGARRGETGRDGGETGRDGARRGKPKNPADELSSTGYITEIVPRSTEIDPAVQNTVQSTVQSTIQSTVQVPLPTEVVRLPTQNTYLRISGKLAENPFQPCRAPPRKTPLAAPAAFHRWPPTITIGKISMRPVQVK